MEKRLLAVNPQSTHYLPGYQVTVAQSFADAQRQIELSEAADLPFDTLDLPARDLAQFWAFLNWMRDTGRNYPFSVFGIQDTKAFWKLCEECRSKGFIFNT